MRKLRFERSCSIYKYILTPSLFHFYINMKTYDKVANPTCEISGGFEKDKDILDVFYTLYYNL